MFCVFFIFLLSIICVIYPICSLSEPHVHSICPRGPCSIRSHTVRPLTSCDPGPPHPTDDGAAPHGPDRLARIETALQSLAQGLQAMRDHSQDFEAFVRNELRHAQAATSQLSTGLCGTICEMRNDILEVQRAASPPVAMGSLPRTPDDAARRRSTMYHHGLMMPDGDAPAQRAAPSPSVPDGRPGFGRGRGVSAAATDRTPPEARGRGPTPPRPETVPTSTHVSTSGIGRDWFPAGSVPAFTGDFDVTSTCPSLNPLVWTRQVRAAMVQRNIPEHLWATKSVSCLTQRVVDRFVASRTGSDVAAITQRFVGRAADPFEGISWDDFVDWLLHTYVRPADVDLMAVQVQHVQCAGVESLQDYIAEFNAACVAADYMSLVIIDHVPHGSDELAHGIQAAADTPERRRYFRAALPHAIQAALNHDEARHLEIDDTWAYTLAALQRGALNHGRILQAAARRGEAQTAHLNHIAVGGETAPQHPEAPAAAPAPRAEYAAELSSLNDKLEQLLHLHAAASRRQGAGGDTSDDDEDADHELFVRITDVMSPPPPEALIQRRRDEGSCLACCENHKWRQCPKITGHPTLAARLREGIQRDRDRRQSGRRRS